MASKDILAVREHIAALPPTDTLTLEQLRARYERAEAAFGVPDGVSAETVRLPEAPAEWVRAAGARSDAAVLYLHGGGYVIGSMRSHRHLAGAIAVAAGMPVLMLDYRLAPENPFPAAVDDALAAYRWLLDQDYAPERLVAAGDSAGGGLAVAMMVTAREAGLPLPAAGVCLSPWTNLACDGDTYASKAETDPIINQDGALQWAKAYLGEADPTTPLASPIHADLAGLPPLLIHVGSEEVLLDDAVRLEKRARDAGVETALEVWEDMIHVWHWFAPMLSEGRDAIEKVGEFIKTKTA